jgi:predicted nucleotidyltransferase
MGTTRHHGSGGRVADALFGPVQQRVLGLLFGQPDRRFQSAELIRLVQGGTGAVQRQLERLEQAGLIESERIGNQKHYQARRGSPVFEELTGLVTKTIGIVEPIRRALEPFARKIHAAFVYGSRAKGTSTARSDIDLMVVSDSVTYPDLYQATQQVEATLARPVNPTVMTLRDWIAKRKAADSFVSRIARQHRLFVIGTPDDLD